MKKQEKWTDSTNDRVDMKLAWRHWTIMFIDPEYPEDAEDPDW